MNEDNKLDMDRLAEAALAILSLTIHDGRIWKSIDWNLMDILYHNGWISDPKNRDKSVCITEEGKKRATEIINSRFSDHAGTQKQLYKKVGSRVGKYTLVEGETDLNSPNKLILIRCTQKLAKELGTKSVTDVQSEGDVLNEWYANLFKIGRRKCLLFVNPRTLYAFPILGVRKPDFLDFGKLFLKAFLLHMTEERILDEKLNERLHNYCAVVIGKTNNRSTLGSMNDLIYHCEAEILDNGGLAECDPINIGRRINRIPFKANEWRFSVELMRDQIKALENREN